MKKVLILCLAASLLVALTGSPTQATLSSTFDASAEGWTGSPAFNFAWHSDGYIGSEYIPDFFLLIAPSSWYGDWSQYLNGTFEFDVKWQGIMTFLRLEISSIDSTYVTYVETLPDSSGDWTHIIFSLDSYGLISGTIEEIFQDVNYVAIYGRKLSSGKNFVYLDNVQVVPLPGAILLLGSGLLPLAVHRRRKLASYT